MHRKVGWRLCVDCAEPGGGTSEETAPTNDIAVALLITKHELGT